MWDDLLQKLADSLFCDGNIWHGWISWPSGTGMLDLSSLVKVDSYFQANEFQSTKRVCLIRAV